MSGPKLLYHHVWLSVLGPLMGLSGSEGLCGLYLSPLEPEEAARDLFGQTPPALAGRGNHILEETAAQVDDYLAGRRQEFSLPLALEGTPFQLKVWRALSQIPFGRVMSYGQVAAAVGQPRAARAVGQAVGENPVTIVVPCHRVVGSRDIGGFGSGLARKRVLLGLEGVREAELDLARLDLTM